MSNLNSIFSRRHFLRNTAFGAALFSTRGLFAEQLFETPPLTEGPFYPDKMPLDRDNDLLIINNSITPAVGEITHLTGRVLDASGNPINNMTVEIWQCDAKGVYLHTASSGPNQSTQDKNFQGFGTFTTGTKGEYRFRTIKPVVYPGRTPHIHVKVKKGDREVLTTQILIRGHAANARDGVFQEAGDVINRELLLADFKPIKESKIGELAANFDIIIGRTPADK